MSETNNAQAADDNLLCGSAALTRGAWDEARARFAAALSEAQTPQALEGLGTAAWGLNDAATVFAARERAYRLYRQRDDCRGAARLATHLAIDHFFYRGEHAIAGAWLRRARRLLTGLEPCAELGWLLIAESQVAGWAEHDFAAVQTLCAQAASIGKALGSLDLEMLALAFAGLALVNQGSTAEGMRRLDEATLAAVAGEMSDIDAACTACCCLIFACEWTRDYDRAAQWIERLNELARRWKHPTLFMFCRTHFAGLLVSQGAWAAAEAELEAAGDALEATQPALAAEALVRLADLRCRQGRFDAAAVLLERAEGPPFGALVGDFCLLGRAGIALAHGDIASAVDLAQRFLRAVPPDNRLERVAGLELLVQALAVRGELGQAREVLAELRAVANAVGTPSMQAAAHFAEGVVAADDHAAAKRCFEDAVDLWTRSAAPWEAALARLELARVLLALGRRATAEQQARRALDALQQLGAAPDAARARALLREIEYPARPSDPAAADEAITARELEVLCLIAAGNSNREIATTLVLSVRTVERHISNIYSKIGASGTAARAKATAYALSRGLTPLRQVARAKKTNPAEAG